MKRKIKCKKDKKENLFLNTWFTLITIWFWTPAVTFQDWNSYNLTFGGICFFFCLRSISPLSTRLLGVRDRCHARLLLEYSVEGPLGHWCFIRHLASPKYIVAECRHIFISGFELSRSWQSPELTASLLVNYSVKYHRNGTRRFFHFVSTYTIKIG